MPHFHFPFQWHSTDLAQHLVLVYVYKNADDNSKGD
jgi:hypothetical protein